MTNPKHRPERQRFLIHAGPAVHEAILPEWWGALDSDVESRSLRFPGDSGNWLDEDVLPESLISAGARLVGVQEVADHQGLADAGVEVGRPVVLRPEPTHPRDRDAIAVWVDGSPERIGYLLGDLAAETMRESHRRRAAYKAIVAGEVRDARTGVRLSVTLLLGPASVWAERIT